MTDSSGAKHERKPKRKNRGPKIVSKLDGIDMSDVVCEIAEPWLELLQLPEELLALRWTVMCAASAWNVTQIGERESRATALDALAEQASAVVPNAEEGEGTVDSVRQTLGAMYLRARELYPDLLRLITNVEVKADEHDGARINITSKPLSRSRKPTTR